MCDLSFMNQFVYKEEERELFARLLRLAVGCDSGMALSASGQPLPLQRRFSTRRNGKGVVTGLLPFHWDDFFPL